MNPVRAGMVDHPGSYKWSSYLRNGDGHPSALITHHSIYDALGVDDTERSSTYRELFKHELEPGEVDKFLKKQLRTTDYRDCERVKFLEDAIKDIVLQQAWIGLLAGANLIGKATTTIAGPDFVQPKMNFTR